MKRPLLCLNLAVLMLSLGAAAHAQPAPELDGRTLSTARHRITLEPSGLPGQIVIEPASYELPLELRDTPDELSSQRLGEIGRGPQLREPMRLVVTTEGGEQTLSPTAEAEPSVEGGAVRAAADLKAEGLEAAVDVSCTGAGVMMLELSYEASGQVEALSLVVPLAGTVDVAIPGSMSDGQGPVGLGPGRGVVWGNSEDDAGDYGRAAPGVLGHLFVGNGDRGFTILTDAGDGWKINDSRSMATIERDDQGRYTLNLHVINEPTTPKGKQQVRLAWVTHPSAPRPEDYRMRQWTTAFDAEPASPEPSLEALAAGDAVANLHGEAVALAPLAKRLALPGPTREQLGDHARDVVDLHAPGAYRYLTGTHTGLIRQVLPRNAQVTNPGGDPAPDRMLLARALLHDAGLDLSGLANATEAVELVSSLTELGFLEPGRVEVIPYWRSGSVLRYGPAFEQDDAFSLAVENPYRHVKITAYRVNGGKTAIIVVSNEGDEPVRDVLYLLDPERLLGGTNVLTGGAIIRKTVDFSKVPQDGDWRPDTLSASRGPALHDLETGSIVPAVVKRGAVAADEYGRLFVAPHEFRVFVVSSDKSGN